MNFRNIAGFARPAVALLALALLAPAIASAQVVPAPPQTRAVALVGGTLHTVANGTIENGTVVFENGKITAVGTNVQIPAGAERIDISGKHVFPGLIDSYSQLGLYEIGGITQTIDTNELGNINPNVRAEVAVNPESRHIGVARSHGVLVAVASPSGGLISGLAAAMALEGWTWEEMLVKPQVGLVVNWPAAGNENRYAAQLTQLRDVFATARAYAAARAAAPDRHDTDSRWEAMIPVLEGNVPVIVSANDMRQIQDAITWSAEEGVRIVIRGGRDADLVAGHLAAKQIPVILTSVINAPSRSWRPYDTSYSKPARLHQAGVRFAISGSASAQYTHRLSHEAGAAVAFGLSAEAALKAVTLNPAQFLGFDDRLGSLEVGKDATLMIATGHPLDARSRYEQAYIFGRRIDMRDAQREFYEKYSEKVRQQRATTDGN